MKWKDLPVEIQEKALETEKLLYPDRKVSVMPEKGLSAGFIWSRSEDGSEFWDQIDEGNFSVFFDKYPKDDFVLPEKWWIRTNTEVKQVVGKWLNENKQNHNIFYDYRTSVYGILNYPATDNGNHTTDGNGKTPPDGYTKITLEQFKRFVLKENKQDMKTNTLTRKQLLEAYKAFTCGTWTSNLETLLGVAMFSPDDEAIEIPQKYIDLLLKDGTSEQRAYVEKLGITLKEDKNAFVKKFPAGKIGDISKELFGNSSIFHITGTSAPSGREDLRQRSFTLHENYNAILLKGAGGRTIIEILKK